jgi:radical SAM superfamily enzyme YgiQ (UPF0313 family)
MGTSIALVGAELEENLGLRYIASALEHAGHRVHIVSFNAASESPLVVRQILQLAPRIVGLSMVFTGRAHEFCDLGQALRAAGWDGHLIAGGPFASFNSERLLQEFPAFDSIGISEGEEIMCALATHLSDLAEVPGICYRRSDGVIKTNPGKGNPENLDALSFPRRTTFHSYFDKPIGSVLTSRGCWRDCAFCSIHAWYDRSGGGKRFRVRSVENLLAELKDLYFIHGVRIFNFQDDNFFVPNHERALARFQALRAGLREAGIGPIAIAIKARPDSITRESVAVLDDLGLFRVFLGVENASQAGLTHLNRRCVVEQVLEALRILNEIDVHIAFNLLMFEPDTTMEDIQINLRFIERHLDNPFNFCRAEAYAGTGLERQLRAEGRLLGDYFGFDYRLKNPGPEAFHQIANFAFFDRNFSDHGLHYFNMQVDFYFQLLRRFHPELITQTMRACVRNFIKQTNLDTYECLCRIYDLVANGDPCDQVRIHAIAQEMRQHVDRRSLRLRVEGEQILNLLTSSYENRRRPMMETEPAGEFFACGPATPYLGLESISQPRQDGGSREDVVTRLLFRTGESPLPYDVFKRQVAPAA